MATHDSSNGPGSAWTQEAINNLIDTRSGRIDPRMYTDQGIYELDIDAPGDFSAAIRLVEKRIAPCLQQLADTAVALRDLLRTPVTS